MNSFKELFKEFMLKENKYHFDLIPENNELFESVKVVFNNNDKKYIIVYNDGSVKFKNFDCDVKNLDILFNALKELSKEMFC